MTKKTTYTSYTKEFKLEALRLLEESDKPASEIAQELGIRRNQLYKWKEQLIKSGDVPSAKRGRPKKEDQSELSKVKQELKRPQEENAIKGLGPPLIVIMASVEDSLLSLFSLISINKQ